MQANRALLFAVLFSTILVLPAQEPAPTAPVQSGGVRLVYELPVDPLQRAMRNATEQSIEQVLEDAMGIVQSRVGTDGKVARLGATGFTVELPRADKARIAHMCRRVGDPGRLEMRVVATNLDRAGAVRFDMAEEKKRLEEWLAHGGKELVTLDAKGIDRFNDDAERGPVATGKLKWFVHFVLPRPADPTRWTYALSKAESVGAVGLFSAADFNDGTVPASIQKLPVAQRRLLEFVPINMAEMHFGSADLVPENIAKAVGPDGTAQVHYGIRADRAMEYADWTEKYIGKHSAIVLNGVVQSAPVFRSRIPGNGVIAGDFTADDAEDLAAVLKTRPLPVIPVLVRQEPLKADPGK